MELESYLIEQKPQILAISRISRILYQTVSDNYYEILNGKIDSTYLDNIQALITSIQMIAYSMRSFRKECFLKIDNSFLDDFTYYSTVVEEL